MDWIWVVPESEAFVSGGNRYNANLMVALQQRGSMVRRISPHEVKDQKNVGSNTVWVWDSMYLEFYENLDFKLPGKAILLLHFIPHEKQALFTHCASQADLLIVPGKGYRTMLTSIGVLDQKILLLIPGYESVPVLKATERKGSLKWLSVANLVPEKGLLDVLNCDVWKQSPNLIPHLDIYGDDCLDVSYTKTVFSILDTSPWANKVYYKGRLHPWNLWSRMGNYDAFLSTSPHESYGMAVRESLQAGLPVFGLAGGHLPQQVDHPQKGLLFEHVHQLCTFIARAQEMEFRQQWPVPIPEKMRPQGPEWGQQAAMLQTRVRQLWLNQTDEGASIA